MWLGFGTSGHSRQNPMQIYRTILGFRRRHTERTRKSAMSDVKLDSALLNQLPVNPAPLLPVGTAGQPVFPKSAGNKETHVLSRSQRVPPYPTAPSSSSL